MGLVPVIYNASAKIVNNPESSKDLRNNFHFVREKVRVTVGHAVTLNVAEWLWQWLSEVPILNVVVEMDALSTTVLGQDVHDVLLLTGREQLLAMIVTVICPTATTKV